MGGDSKNSRALPFPTKRGVAKLACSDFCPRGFQSVPAWWLLPGALCPKSKKGKAFCEIALGLAEYKFQPQEILRRESCESEIS